MNTRFWLIFWGLLIVLLRISINGVDLLPDIVGHWCIAAGCAGLSEQSRKFFLAALASGLLAILWILSYAIAPDESLAFAFGYSAANCLQIWFLLGGIAEMGIASSKFVLASAAHRLRAAFVAVMIASTITPLMVSQNSDLAGFLVVSILIAFFAVMILILRLIHRARRTFCAEALSDTTTPAMAPKTPAHHPN